MAMVKKFLNGRRVHYGRMHEIGMWLIGILSGTFFLSAIYFFVLTDFEHVHTARLYIIYSFFVIMLMSLLSPLFLQDLNTSSIIYGFYVVAGVFFLIGCRKRAAEISGRHG